MSALDVSQPRRAFYELLNSTYQTLNMPKLLGVRKHKAIPPRHLH